jgi:small-conductance mechanosensitive channel
LGVVEMSVLDEIDPRTWLWRAVGAAGALALLWFGVINPYNNYVSAKKVAAALAGERAKTEPVFKELTASFNALKGTFDNITAASTAEARRQKNQLEIKQKGYDHAIANTKKLKAELDAMRGSDVEFERLLNAVAANNSTKQASQSDRYERLEAAHQQCERDIRYASETAAGTIERLSEAVASIEALKN